MPLRMLEAMEIVIILTFIKHLPSRVIRPHVGDQITQKNPRRKAQPQLVMKDCKGGCCFRAVRKVLSEEVTFLQTPEERRE